MLQIMWNNYQIFQELYGIAKCFGFVFFKLEKEGGKNLVNIVTPSENEALIRILLEDPPAD